TQGVVLPSFYKSLRFPKAEPWSRSAEREIIPGVFFCKLFFCANGVKRKVAKDAERAAGYTPKLDYSAFSFACKRHKMKKGYASLRHDRLKPISAWQKENAE
ncbi:MAG: hypothetical protein IJX62_09645, partial [Clostridia bacterium]|nr:hypothetical protein [Clostridia bacterium]